jgi:uncharacterized protein GlcG (DUF336 family)
MRIFALLLIIISCFSASVQAETAGCEGLPNFQSFKDALIKARTQNNGGYNNDMWGAVVNRAGIICLTAYTGKEVHDQWPGSRGIAAEKAYTANAFSLPAFSISTANLYAGSQPGGPLFGLLTANPVDVSLLNSGDANLYGTSDDPIIGKRLGGTVTFGGGLALYNKEKKLLGALGVSGDSSCADHNIAWRLRHELNLDFVPAGATASKTQPDNIVYDIVHIAGHDMGISSSGWGHAACNGDVQKIASALPEVQK